MAIITTAVRDMLDDSSLPEFQASQLGTALYEQGVGQLVYFTYDQTAAANAAAQTMFTAPFPLRILDVMVHGKNAEAAVVTIDNGTTAISTAITAANGALVHMSAGLVEAELTMATGEILTMQTGAAASLCRVTTIAMRI